MRSTIRAQKITNILNCFMRKREIQKALQVSKSQRNIVSSTFFQTLDCAVAQYNIIGIVGNNGFFGMQIWCIFKESMAKNNLTSFFSHFFCTARRKDMVWICACLVVMASLAVSMENGNLQGRQEVEQDRYRRLARIQRVRRWVTIRVVGDKGQISKNDILPFFLIRTSFFQSLQKRQKKLLMK